MSRRSAAAVALLVLSLSSSLYAQVLGSCSTIERWGSRGTPRSYVALGSQVAVADGRGLTLYDVSNPATIVQTQVIGTARESLMLAESGDHLVLLTRDQLQLYRVDSGSARETAHDIADATQVVANESTIVTGGSELTLWTREGDALLRGARLPVAAPVDALLLRGKYLFVGERGSVTTVYDTTGGRLTPVGVIAASAASLAVRGDTLFLGGVGISVVDISDPTSPRIVGTALTDSAIDALTISGSRLFASAAHASIVVFDINADGSLAERERIPQPVDALLADGDRLFVGGMRRDQFNWTTETGVALRVFDISGARAAETGEFLDYAGGINGVSTDGRYAFVADAPLMRVLDLQSEPIREVASVDYGDGSDRTILRDHWVIVYGRQTAHMIDVSDPLRPQYRGAFSTKGANPNRAIFLDGYLVESNFASGLHIVDVSDPAHPGQIGGVINDQRGRWMEITGFGKTLYGVVDKGIKVVDLTNPRTRTYSNFIAVDAPRDVEMARVGGRDVMLVSDNDVLRVFDATRPLTPVEIGSVQVSRGDDIVTDGPYAYVLTRGVGVYKVDLSAPESPRVVASDTTNFTTTAQLSVRDGLILAASRYSLIVARPGAPLVAPTLTSRNSAGLTTTLTWSGAEGGRYEVQSSATSDFSDAESNLTLATSAGVPLENRYWRVRSMNGCGASEWSNIVPTGAQSGGVGFASNSSRVFVTDATKPLTIHVSLLNRGSVVAPFSFVTSAGITTTNGVAQPGVITSSDVTIAPSVLQGDGFDLQLVGDATAHHVTLSRLTLEEREIAGGAAIVVPGVGATAGAAGTQWKSLLDVFCQGSSTCDVTLAYLPAGASREVSTMLTLAPGELFEVDDVVRNLFGRSDTTGVLRITSSGSLESISAAAYTYNDSPSGRFGQRIAGRVVAPVAGSARAFLLGVDEDSTTRTNLGFFNASDSAAAVGLELHDADGSIAASRTVTVPPMSTQPLFVAEFGRSTTGGYIVVDAPSSVLAWSSSVDRVTGDAVFSHAVPAPQQTSNQERLYLFDAAGSTPGADSSQWRTALQLLSTTDVTIRLTFVPSVDPSRTYSEQRTLAANVPLASRDAMAELFAAVPAELRGNGSIRVEAVRPLLGWGRVYNTSARGTFGQFVPLREATLAATTDRFATQSARIAPSPNTHRGALPGVARTALVRTNLGIIETSGKYSAVRISTLDRSGTIVDFEERLIQPYESLLLLDYLAARGLSGLESGTIEIREIAGDGRVESFASVVQSRTNDAVMITPR